MRHATVQAAVLSIVFIVSVVALPEAPFTTFVTPLIQHFFGIENGNDTSPAAELRKRQDVDVDIGDSCPEDYDSCVGLGAAGLCCSSDAQCALDNAGRVACCPNGAACTGIVDLPEPTDDIQSVTSFELASTTGGVIINVDGTSTQGFVVATTEISSGERLMVSIEAIGFLLSFLHYSAKSVAKPPALPLLRSANGIPYSASRQTAALTTLAAATIATLTALRWRRGIAVNGRSL